jgi:hypothetical protein
MGVIKKYKKKIKKKNSHPQLEREGAVTLQTEGRVKALVTFKTTPN